MQRTIATAIVSILVGILCGMFILLDLTIDAIIALINSPSSITEAAVLGGSLFQGTITPVSTFIEGGYAPIAVLGISGFISGLIAKNGTRSLVSNIIFMGVFFMGFIALTGEAPMTFEIIRDLATDMTWDLAIAFFILFISGLMGAACTEDPLDSVL